MQKNIFKYKCLFLIVFCLLFMTSCAKKVVQSEPMMAEIESVAEEPAETEDPELAAGEQAEQAELDLKQSQLAEQAAKEEAERAKVTAAQMFMNADIYFDFDSSALEDAAKERLFQKAQWPRANPEASVIIEGHCDERGTSAYNIALGDSRAESAKSYLSALGVEAGRLSKISYGEERPIDTGSGEEAWAQNRRAHFVIE